MASTLLPQASGLAAPPSSTKPAGKVLCNKYEVSIKLGAGLQGKVYLGKDKETGDLVALKCMDRAAIDANPKVKQNVERELQAMMKVSSHKGVVQALDINWKAEWPRSSGGTKVSKRKSIADRMRAFLHLKSTFTTPFSPTAHNLACS